MWKRTRPRILQIRKESLSVIWFLFLAGKSLGWLYDVLQLRPQKIDLNFEMKFWTWESGRLDECRVCSSWTTSAIWYHFREVFGAIEAHISSVTTFKLVELGDELLLHLPYSSDLPFCDFFLFPNFKKVTRRAEIWIKWGGRCRHWGLVCLETSKQRIFRQVKKIVASLGQEYRTKKKLCREINHLFFSVHFSFVG